MPHSVASSYTGDLRRHHGRAKSDASSAAANQGAVLMQGRTGPSTPRRGGGASVSNREPYYSNEDIELLHDIVSTGEEILTSLPERERLPTNALFRAADIVLPRYGHDSEDDVPHISRLLFRIGGMRGNGSLQDKFRSVLNSMGIELEYVDDTTDVGSQLPASPSHRTLETNGDLANSQRRTVQRRRSSHGDATDTIPTGKIDVLADAGHRRVRSLSTGRSKHIAQRLRFADEEANERITSESLQSSPNYHVERQPPTKNLAHRPRLAPAPVLKPSINSNIYQSHAQDFRQPSLRPQPTLDDTGVTDWDQASATEDLPRRNGGHYGVSDDEKSIEHDISHSVSSSVDGYEGQSNQHGHYGHQAHDNETVEEDVPADGSYDAVASDDEQNVTFDQIAFLEATEQNFLRSAFDCWRRVAQSKRLNSQQRMALAARWDREEAISEALAIWSDNAGIELHDGEGRTVTRTLQDRQEAIDHAQREVTIADADPAGIPQGSALKEIDIATAQEAAEAEYEAGHRAQPVGYDDLLDVEENPKYALAAAAWDYFLVSKAFTHWAGRAQEEVQRTAVARRHILRKKCFNAWVDQKSEDDSRVTSFPKIYLLRQWYDALIDQEHSGRIIDQAYERGLVERVFWAWFGEYKVRSSLAAATRRMKEDSLQSWRSATSSMLQTGDAANVYDSQNLVKGAAFALVSTYETSKIADVRANQIATTKDVLVKSDLLLQWRQQSRSSTDTAERLAKQELQQTVKHWIYERRLSEYRRTREFQDLEQCVHQWHCETRLEVVKRWFLEDSTRHYTKRWSLAALEAETNWQNLYDTAAAMDRGQLASSFFESALPAVKHIEMQKNTANSIYRQQSTPTVVAQWEEQLSIQERLRRWSDLGSFYSGVKDQFDHWRVNAKRSRKRRLGELYRTFRFQYKLDIVKNCLDVWREATADAITSTWDADDVKAEYDRSLLEDNLGIWQDQLSFVRFSNQVAVEADQEAYLMAWQSELEITKEANMDAQEYDAGQTLNEYWEDWVLATLQQRSRHPTVVEMQGHNSKRLRRQALAIWLEQTYPNREPEVDFRSSRRSTRFITPARSRMIMDYSSLNLRPPSELTFDEHDEGPSFEDSRL